MPEGPEVRHHARRLQPMVGKQLTSVQVLSGRYIKKAIENMSKPVGEEILEIDVKGKLIAIYFRNAAILSTAGMSGQWIAGDPDHKFKRIQLKVVGEDGVESVFTFCDMRNFGTFKVVKPSEADKKLMELGPDIFGYDTVPPTVFERLTRFGKNQALAEALMDQRIFCGVGNYIRAEAIFIAKLDPRKPAIQLTGPEVSRLWKAIHEVAQSAYELERDYHDLCYRRTTTDDGRKVESFVDRNGRTVWFVPGNV